MQREKIYEDLLHLTGEWMNADMVNRGTEDRPRPLSLYFFIFFMEGGETSPPLVCFSAWFTEKFT
jgi:hypothetical protein